jgi:hypothetical protein
MIDNEERGLDPLEAAVAGAVDQAGLDAKLNAKVNMTALLLDLDPANKMCARQYCMCWLLTRTLSPMLRERAPFTIIPNTRKRSQSGRPSQGTGQASEHEQGPTGNSRTVLADEGTDANRLRLQRRLSHFTLVTHYTTVVPSATVQHDWMSPDCLSATGSVGRTHEIAERGQPGTTHVSTVFSSQVDAATSAALLAPGSGKQHLACPA